jgi:ribonuclease HI
MKRIDENELKRIVNEMIDEYIDGGVFTSDRNGYRMPDDRTSNDREYQALLNALNSIGSKIYTEAQYMRRTCNVVNPMFIRGIQDPKKRKMAEIAQKTYAKCMDLYNFLSQSKDEMKGL